MVWRKLTFYSKVYFRIVCSELHTAFKIEFEFTITNPTYVCYLQLSLFEWLSQFTDLKAVRSSDFNPAFEEETYGKTVWLSP